MANVIANGVRLHLQRFGNQLTDHAGPVVFIHGLVMDNLSSWYFTAANRVACQRQVLLYDLRGHGRSERPQGDYAIADMVADLAALLDTEGITAPVALVGNSFGGLLALAYASAYPTRVERIVLVDAHVGIAGWGTAMAATLRLTGSQRDRKIASSFQDWLGRHSERKRNRLAQTAHALVYETSLVDDLQNSPALSARDLAAISCPVLALYGEHSDVVDDTGHLSRNLADFQLDIVPGCTHSILWEATDTVCHEIEQFCTQPAAIAPLQAQAGGL